jgi:hypothetical protein
MSFEALPGSIGKQLAMIRVPWGYARGDSSIAMLKVRSRAFNGSMASDFYEKNTTLEFDSPYPTSTAGRE